MWDKGFKKGDIVYTIDTSGIQTKWAFVEYVYVISGRLAKCMNTKGEIEIISPILLRKA